MNIKLLIYYPTVMKVVANGWTTYYWGDDMTTLECVGKSWKVVEDKRKN